MNIRFDKNDIKQKVEILLREGKSTNQMSIELNVNNGTLIRWMKEWNFTPNRYKNILINGILHKRCPRCKQIKEINKENFLFGKGGNFSWCKPCVKKETFLRHYKFKLKAVEYKGGKCQKCGYKKCIAALDFHHINPSEKDFEISFLKYSTWEDIKRELDKCICLCRNCHAELHYMENSLENG